MTQIWTPEDGLKATWESINSIQFSLQLFIEALFNPISKIISQSHNFSHESWGSRSTVFDNKLDIDIGATCTNFDKNGFLGKGIFVVQIPIDNTTKKAITWFTILFDGSNKETSFNPILDYTPRSFGGIVTNAPLSNLKTLCSH